MQINLFFIVLFSLLLIAAPFFFKLINIINLSTKLLFITSAITLGSRKQKAIPMVIISFCLMFVFENIRKRFNFIVFNVTEENHNDIDMIVQKFSYQDNKIEVIKGSKNIEIRGEKKHLKKHSTFIKEINRYVKNNGKINTKSFALVMLGIIFLAYMIAIR